VPLHPPSYCAIATSDDFPISGSIFKEASEFKISFRDGARLSVGNTKHFTLKGFAVLYKQLIKWRDFS
jgi:hypothetical protein